MRKLSSGLRCLTVGIRNLSKTGGCANLRAIAAICAPGNGDPGGSRINSLSFRKSWALNSERYGVSRCPMDGFGDRTGKDSRRSHCSIPERSSSCRQKGAEAAKTRKLHPHHCNREYSNFESLDLSGQSIQRAQQAATERARKHTLLSSPGAISADIGTQRLFIADTNHHRVIIANECGEIVDCIGSIPGMEDGTFEAAQLCNPASAVLDANLNFLYIADSEGIYRIMSYEGQI